MPRKYARRKTTRRKTRRYRKSPVAHYRPPLKVGFPKMYKFVHKYVETISLTSTTGNLASYQYSCNGLYDPNTTGGGHQPLYFDQMAAIFDHYCVIGSKIKVTMMPQTTTSQDNCVACLWINDDTTTTPSTMANIQETKYAKFMGLAGGANSNRTAVLRWSAKKYFGGSVLANTELQGTNGANPTEQTHFQITMQDVYGSTAVVNFNVEIIYIAVWKELKDIASS